jgi:putative ABC transport system ATP-binding protein
MTTKTVTDTRTVTIPASRDPVLHVTGLTKTFGEGELAVTAVAGVDLDVHPAEVILIMGPSGSGKTTLLLMLGAMLRPTAGAIQVAGLDLARAPERRLPGLRARRFGFVFQDFNLLGALTVAENVELACNLAGTTGQAAHQRARALLGRVGLDHRLSFRPEQLSGGEKQRVAIARALANDPPVILADEPTANLDSAIGRQVARLLRQLATQDQRAVVIVSHDTRLEEIADRVLWLEDGTFRELDTLATDPVCGMTVARHDQPHLRRNGTVWWFCSTACREEFAADPNHFTPGSTGHASDTTTLTGEEPQHDHEHQQRATRTRYIYPGGVRMTRGLE